jgi:hypothetical protein
VLLSILCSSYQLHQQISTWPLSNSKLLVLAEYSEFILTITQFTSLNWKRCRTNSDRVRESTARLCLCHLDPGIRCLHSASKRLIMPSHMPSSFAAAAVQGSNRDTRNGRGDGRGSGDWYVTSSKCTHCLSRSKFDSIHPQVSFRRNKSENAWQTICRCYKFAPAFHRLGALYTSPLHNLVQYRKIANARFLW